jgi:hypothetical protein
MHIHLSSSPWHQYTWPQPQILSEQCQVSTLINLLLLKYKHLSYVQSLYLPLTTFIASWPEVWSWCHDSWPLWRRGILRIQYLSLQKIFLTSKFSYFTLLQPHP